VTIEHSDMKVVKKKMNFIKWFVKSTIYQARSIDIRDSRFKECFLEKGHNFFLHILLECIKWSLEVLDFR
jgi:hypothetical protein